MSKMGQRITKRKGAFKEGMLFFWITAGSHGSPSTLTTL